MAGVYDPKVIAILAGVPECLRWFRNNCGADQVLRDSLFIYRHTQSGNFMLARWLMYRSVFLPILELGDAPVLSDQAVVAFRFYVHPDPERTAEAALKQAADNQERGDEEFDAQREENRARMLQDECGIKVRHTDGGVFAPTSILGG
jgi:hypothetical protein